ncbi:hypothetical protein VUR80DRAFT_8260 [Thermomyces stellatus]
MTEETAQTGREIKETSRRTARNQRLLRRPESGVLGSSPAAPYPVVATPGERLCSSTCREVVPGRGRAEITVQGHQGIITGGLRRQILARPLPAAWHHGKKATAAGTKTWTAVDGRICFGSRQARGEFETGPVPGGFSRPKTSPELTTVKGKERMVEFKT